MTAADPSPAGDHPVETAADLAAVAALLEIAEELGVSPLLDGGGPFTGADLALAALAPAERVGGFLDALLAAGLVQRAAEPGRFVGRPDLADLRYQAGYLSWALTANRPYLENAPEFLRDPDAAGQKYRRDGRWVAVSSRWVGSQGFYPSAFAEITGSRPARVVDLGAGAGGLLVHLLGTLPGSSGVAVDLSPAGCAEAERAADRAGVADRLRVVNRAIESLVDDPSPLRGADVVHAGFVLHDVVAQPGVLDAVLRTCREALVPAGRMVVAEAVPYVPDPRERAFSALFTYLHAACMGVRLPTEDEWLAAFRRAGFTGVRCVRLRMPTSRMFVAAA